MLSHPALSSALATERERAAREQARTAWKRRRSGELRVRVAVEADMAALVRLARLDSSRPPTGTILVAEDDGEIVAAMSAEDGAAIANPFRPTARILAMLRLRAGQIDGLEERPSRRAMLSFRRLRTRSAIA